MKPPPPDDAANPSPKGGLNADRMIKRFATRGTGGHVMSSGNVTLGQLGVVTKGSPDADKTVTMAIAGQEHLQDETGIAGISDVVLIIHDKNTNTVEYLVFEHEGQRLAANYGKWLGYIAAVYRKYFITFTCPIIVSLIVLFGPKIRRKDELPFYFGPDKQEISFIYLNDFANGNLFNILDEKIINNEQPTILEFIGLLNLPMAGKAKFDFQIFDKCKDYIDNSGLFNKDFHHDYYLFISHFYPRYLSGKALLDFQKEFPMDLSLQTSSDYLERIKSQEEAFKTELKRKDDALAVSAKWLLENGCTRAAIIKKLGVSKKWLDEALKRQSS